MSRAKVSAYERLFRSSIPLAVVLALTVAGSGCGYSLAGRGSYLPAYIKTIGVPLFVNNTSVFEIERRVTEDVRAELIGRGRYTVETNRTGVDAVLVGEILSIGIAPAAVNQQQQATRYAVTLVAKVEFRDLKTDKPLWANPAMVFSEQFDVTTATTAIDPNAFLGQNVNALQRLSSEFARAVVSAILESF
jgi:Lipopolysaccharide-assembly